MEEAKQSRIEILRQKIQKMVEENHKEGDLLLNESDAMKFIHEIEVQQVELEMQNEELKKAGEQEIIAARKYADLYDFAPSGYFTLTSQGIIKEINLCGAGMLGKERSSLINGNFGFFVSEDTRTDFNHFLSEIFTGKEKKTCDVILSDQGNEPIYVSLTGIADQNGEQCYLTAIDITDRKRTEQELIESEHKFTNLVWDMQVGVLIQGPQSEILFSNRQAHEYLGLNEDQLLGKTSFDPYWNVIHEDGSPFPGGEHPVPQALATGLPVRDVVMGVYHPHNDTRVWLLVDAIPQFNADGNVKQVVCNFIDISRRKQAEEELRISEEKYKAIFDQSVDGKSMTSVAESKMKVNKAFCELLGYSEAELAALEWQTITHPDDLEGDEKMIGSLLSGAKETARWEKRYIHKNGNTVWVDISTRLQRDKENKPLFFNTSVIDISERKRVEAKLTESNTKFQTIFENNSAAMAIISPDTTILMVNDEYCKMSGYAREEVIGTSWTKQIPPDDLERLQEYNRRRLIDPQDAPDKYEFKFYKKNGEIVYSYMSVSMYGRMIIVSFVDFTPRIQAEHDLLKKMEELLLFQRLTVDRELKMVELKKEVNELLRCSGKDGKYRIVE